MKNAQLIFDSKNEYWYCSKCGAVYRQPENWNPPCDYCMRCKIQWAEIVRCKNEND